MKEAKDWIDFFWHSGFGANWRNEMILMIDNYDSFTSTTLSKYCMELGADLKGDS